MRKSPGKAKAEENLKGVMPTEREVIQGVSTPSEKSLHTYRLTKGKALQ